MRLRSLKAAASPTAQSNSKEELQVLNIHLYLLKEMNRQYDAAVNRYVKAQLRIVDTICRIHDLKAEISREMSLAVRRFNHDATDIARATLGEEFQGTIGIDNELKISINRAGSTLSVPQVSSRERTVLSAILAAITLASYRPHFPFMAIDGNDLFLGAAVCHRLAHMLNRIVEHIIYTVVQENVEGLRVVSCKHDLR
jgi:hypothetical protein